MIGEVPRSVLCYRLVIVCLSICAQHHQHLPQQHLQGVHSFGHHLPSGVLHDRRRPAKAAVVCTRLALVCAALSVCFSEAVSHRTHAVQGVDVARAVTTRVSDGTQVHCSWLL